MRRAHPTPRWAAITSGRRASVFECLWNSLRQTPTPNYFTPNQWQLLQRLQQLSGGGSSSAIIQQVETAWATTRNAYLDAAVHRVIRDEVLTVLYGDMHAIDGAVVDHARRQLVVMAGLVSEDEMQAILDALPRPPPTPGEEEPLLRWKNGWLRMAPPARRGP